MELLIAGLLADLFSDEDVLNELFSIFDTPIGIELEFDSVIEELMFYDIV